MKIMLINPSKWGRGITPIWVASHAGLLKSLGHVVSYFDCTFFNQWSDFEQLSNENTGQYKKTDYYDFVDMSNKDVFYEFQKKVDEFEPDILIPSAFSSHIHGEGEYVNVEYAGELIKALTKKPLVIAGGIQVTALKGEVFRHFDWIDIAVFGDSEPVLKNLLKRDLSSLINGQLGATGNVLHYTGHENSLTIEPPKKNMDELAPYDYSIFAQQTFWRSYNGNVLKAVDYELSRGCIYTCHYCVETVIQQFYEVGQFNKHGVLTKANSYLRSKSARRVFNELEILANEFNVELIRCQDTNFLSISPKMLVELAELIEKSDLPLKLYIETRPEGINAKTIELLKRLRVDGVGMGVELAGQEFREGQLNRFSNQNKIVRAFDLLAEHGIKRTAYNVIGFPGQSEESILATIQFNQRLNPDNITVAFYSPYRGTYSANQSIAEGLFDLDTTGVDGQLRTKTIITDGLSSATLNYYKENFVELVRQVHGQK